MTTDPHRLYLNAGNAIVEFNPETGMLGRVKVGGTEVIRGIYGAVRDANWGTPPPQLSNLIITEGSLRFDALVPLPTGDFRWRGEVRLTEQSLEFRFDGEGEVDTNRAGLCLLFPPSFGGLECLVEHTDGSVERGAFPDRIAPHQPFVDIRALKVSGVLQVEGEGDTFEVEDQRNWTDASFKLYCRPLDLPKPYRPGKVSQRIFIRFGNVLPTPPVPVAVHIGTARWRLPSIGTVGEEAVGLPLGHLRSSRGEGRQTQTDLGTGETFYIVDPPEAAGPGEIPGTDTSFTELNRARPRTNAPAVSFASNAQMHTFDNGTIVESAPMLGECVRTAQSFFEGPIHVGPVTMRPRGQAEPRELEPIAAGWVLGGIAALSAAGAASVTYLDSKTLAASPAAEVIRALAGREECLETVVSVPDTCAALAFPDGTMLLANLTGSQLEISGYTLSPYEFRIGSHG